MRFNKLFRLIAGTARFGNDFLYVSVNATIYIVFFIEALFYTFCLFVYLLLDYLKDTLAAYDIQLRTANDGCIMH